MEEKLLIDSIIFDVDGTLWDSTDVVADAWNQIMEKETSKNSMCRSTPPS